MSENTWDDKYYLYLPDTNNITFNLTNKDQHFSYNAGSSYVRKAIDITVNAQSATPNFDGGEISGSLLTNNSNVVYNSTTNNSGASITITPKINRAAVLYNGAVEGWVSKTDNATALAAQNNISLTPTTYYIDKVTLTKPTSGSEHKFAITVPNGGNDTITFNFTVDSNGNTTVT